MAFLNTDKKPSIDVYNNRMTLSLPDAMTPVVWVIDLEKSGTFMMRVDKDENGLFVLQKIEGVGKTAKIEDIAYYASKPKAVAAMTMVSRSNPESSEGYSGGLKSTLFFVLKTVCIIVAFLFIALFIMGLAFNGLGFNEATMTSLQQQAIVEQQQNIITNDPNSVGVPMPADDFLSNNAGLLPF